MTHLYRHFDDNQKLLYVGIANSSLCRLAGHKSCSSWFPLIKTVTIDSYKTRQLAATAESHASDAVAYADAVLAKLAEEESADK